MKLAIISDLHANYEALKVVSDLFTQVDKVLFLGDFIGYYCQVNEVLDFIRNLDAICVLGNHDSYLLFGCPENANRAVRFGIEFANRVITPEHRQWLSGLPLMWAGFLGRQSILITHGSPWRPLNDYLYADNPLLNQLAIFDYDVIVFGQTHRSLQRLDNKPYLLNPGAVGQSRDAKAEACAMVLDTTTFTVEQIRRQYDPTPVIQLAMSHGAKAWITKHLL